MVSEFRTEPVKRPEILDRLAAFLPNIRDSNTKLSPGDIIEVPVSESGSESNSESGSEIESDTNNENTQGRVIELDLGLGVFDAPGASISDDTPVICESGSDTLVTELENNV